MEAIGYEDAPLQFDIANNIMQTISRKAGLSDIYHNHGIRSMMISASYEAGSTFTGCTISITNPILPRHETAAAIMAEWEAVSKTDFDHAFDPADI
eukprot:gene3331-4188_t